MNKSGIYGHTSDRRTIEKHLKQCNDDMLLSPTCLLLVFAFIVPKTIRKVITIHSFVSEEDSWEFLANSNRLTTGNCVWQMEVEKGHFKRRHRNGF